MKRVIFIAAILMPAVCSAANPQTATLFDLTLGAPLSLPECKLNANGGVDRLANSQICARPWPESGPIRTYDIGIPTDRRPAFLKFPEIEVEVIDGRIEEILISTTGQISQREVFSQLADKFNQPTDVSEDKLQNAAGAEFRAINARWFFAGDQVIELHGIDGKVDSGYITAFTKKWAETQAKGRAPAPHL